MMFYNNDNNSELSTLSIPASNINNVSDNECCQCCHNASCWYYRLTFYLEYGVSGHMEIIVR
jgi:hypothetical protein